MKTKKDSYTFILKGRRPASFRLQSNDSKARRLLGPSKSGSGRTRPMRYLENHESPFIDEQELKSGEEGMLGDIIFEDGSLTFSSQKQNLYDFLVNHPDYNQKFEEFDPEKEMDETFDYIALRNQAEAFVIYNLSKDGELDLVKGLIEFLEEVSTESMSPSMIRHRAISLASNQPEEVIRYSESDKVTYSLVARQILQHKLVSRKPGPEGLLIVKETGEVVCKVMEGDKDYVKSLEFAMIEDVNIYKKMKDLLNDD